MIAWLQTLVSVITFFKTPLQIEDIGIPNQSFMNQVIKQGTTNKESQQKNPLFQQQLEEAGSHLTFSKNFG